MLHLQTFFRTAYTCGLRQGETRHLTPEDVLTDRMLLRVRTTKGLNERTVPLPIETLRALRQYWATHRNPRWLFPSRASLDEIASAAKPISERSVQRGLQQIVASLGWKIPGLCVHTLRHSYATAMLEEGVNLKVLQTYLGQQLQHNQICRGPPTAGLRRVSTPTVKAASQLALEGFWKVVDFWAVADLT